MIPQKLIQLATAHLREKLKFTRQNSIQSNPICLILLILSLMPDVVLGTRDKVTIALALLLVRLVSHRNPEW